MTDLVQIAPGVTAAFLASLVEGVEALTIVLAIASVRGWRPAGLGAISAIAVLVLAVVTLGPLLTLVPLKLLQLMIGTLLVYLGASWLRKAILRAAGLKAMKDEELAFATQAAELRERAAKHDKRLDWVAGISSFKAVLVEGLEVVFIVVALSAGHGSLVPASSGAIAACALVAIAGYILHRPLSRVPENLLKFAVGVMLLAFGIFWLGEGLGVAWPGANLAIPALMVAILVMGGAAIVVLRTHST